MSELSSLVEKNVKLGVELSALPDNKSPEYNKDVEGAYVREDQYLSKQINEVGSKCLEDMDVAFAAKDEVAFKSHREKMSKIHELACSGKKEDVAKYLASVNPEKVDKVAELSAKVESISAKLEEMKNSKFFKMGADMNSPEEKAEKSIFNEMKALIDTLEKTHGGK